MRMWADEMEDWYFAGCGVAHEDFDFEAAQQHRHDRHSNDDMMAAYYKRFQRTCSLEPIPYKPGEYEGMRCTNCKTVDLDMGSGPFCSGCGSEVRDA